MQTPGALIRDNMVIANLIRLFTLLYSISIRIHSISIRFPCLCLSPFSFPFFFQFLASPASSYLHVIVAWRGFLFHSFLSFSFLSAFLLFLLFISPLPSSSSPIIGPGSSSSPSLRFSSYSVGLRNFLFLPMNIIFIISLLPPGNE